MCLELATRAYHQNEIELDKTHSANSLNQHDCCDEHDKPVQNEDRVNHDQGWNYEITLGEITSSFLQTFKISKLNQSTLTRIAANDILVNFNLHDITMMTRHQKTQYCDESNHCETAYNYIYPANDVSTSLQAAAAAAIVESTHFRTWINRSRSTRKSSQNNLQHSGQRENWKCGKCLSQKSIK